jgi:hypothetical protein
LKNNEKMFYFRIFDWMMGGMWESLKKYLEFSAREKHWMYLRQTFRMPIV